MNRLISVGELRPVTIKHLVELSAEHDFFCHFFLREKPVMAHCGIFENGILLVYATGHKQYVIGPM